MSINSYSELYVPLANDDYPATNGSNLSAYGAAWNVGKGASALAKKELSPRSPTSARDVYLGNSEGAKNRDPSRETSRERRDDDERKYSLTGSGRTVIRGASCLHSLSISLSAPDSAFPRRVSNNRAATEPHIAQNVSNNGGNNFVTGMLS